MILTDPLAGWNLSHIASWLWKITTTAPCVIFLKSELVVSISFNNHDTNFASWHIFPCHNALWLFKNSHNTQFRVVAVYLMPQSVVVVFSSQWAFSIFERNIYIYTQIFKLRSLAIQILSSYNIIQISCSPPFFKMYVLIITFTNVKLRITFTIYYPKTLRSSTLFPTHSTNSTQLTVPARTTLYWHFSLSQRPWLQQL